MTTDTKEVLGTCDNWPITGQEPHSQTAWYTNWKPVAPPEEDDFRPSKFHLSNSEVSATGILCGGAVANIARELLELRAKVYHSAPPESGGIQMTTPSDPAAPPSAKEIVLAVWPDAYAYKWGGWRDGEEGWNVKVDDRNVRDVKGSGDTEFEAWEDAASRIAPPATKEVSAVEPYSALGRCELCEELKLDVVSMKVCQECATSPAATVASNELCDACGEYRYECSCAAKPVAEK